MSYRGSLTSYKRSGRYTARGSVAMRSKLAALKAGVRRRNRAPRVKGAIYGGRKELKYVDSGILNLQCSTTGTVTCVNMTAVGDDNTTRDGRQATMKSVQINGVIRGADLTVSTTLARVMLVWDNAINSGSLPAITDILVGAFSESFPNINNQQRFTILYDSMFGLGAAQDTATQAFNGAIPHPVKVYKKLNHVTQYSGTTAAIGSIQNGALYLVTVGDQSAGDCANLYCGVRVRFTDD